MPVAGENPTHLGEILRVRLLQTSQVSQKFKHDTQCVLKSVEWISAVSAVLMLVTHFCA